jgi:hypothetical protein
MQGYSVNYKYLVNLLYNCHNLPQNRKDWVAVRLSGTITRANIAVWRQLLVNALVVKEEFFKAYSPVQKSKILADLCESMRRIKRTESAKKLFEVMDHIYCLADGEPSDGKASSFFRMRLRQNPDKQVRAMLAAVIMELPEQYHRVEEVAAAVHGDYLLSIRAMERLCGLGESGLKALYHLLEEVSFTPAITFTLLKLIEETRSRDSLKRAIAAKVYLRAGQEDTTTARPNSGIHAMRCGQVSRGLRSSAATAVSRFGKWRRSTGREDPVSLRFTATRQMKMKSEGGCHVSEENHTNAALLRRPAAYPGGFGKERLRLSLQLTNKGLPAQVRDSDQGQG